VNLPVAASIGIWAFASTGGQALTLTLGDTPPMLGMYMFFSVISSKTVTVKRGGGSAA
jgi:hypothetical protein